MSSEHLSKRIPIWADNVGSLRTFGFVFLPLVVGLAMAVLVHLQIVFPRIQTGSDSLQRCIALGERIKEGFGDTPTVVFIGDSVSVEGIDAQAVTEAAPAGWRILNLSLNGGDRLEQQVMIPALAQSKAGMIVWVCRPMLLGAPQANLHPDRAAAYCLAGFPSQWPTDRPTNGPTNGPTNWMDDATQGITPELLESLTGSTVKAKVHFRTAMTQNLGEVLRGLAKQGDFRSSEVDDWTSPYQMNVVIEGDRLQKHIEVLCAEHADRLARRGSTDDLGNLIRYLSDHGIKICMVMAPIHPIIRERGCFDPHTAELAALGASLAQSQGVLFLDASAVLDAPDFADAQHPSASGRRKLSTFIGRNLPPPVVSPIEQDH